ncbi:HD-GYP domain-containing protein [Limnobacter sp.]|uniref:HD-GYP domain-containing protein n=1 Tax=Limnobacter sp. TaxID=2003368 RepID=UPI0035147BAD
MLINISNGASIAPLIHRKSILPEQLYFSSGKQLRPGQRLGADGLIALELELSQSTLLYLQAKDLFEELACAHAVLSKALLDEDPDTFLPAIDELANRIEHIATHHFDLAYAYLAWHTADDYPVMHHLLVALTLVRAGQCSAQFEGAELRSYLKAALTMNLSMLTLQARLRDQKEPLTREQRETIRKHPEQSANKLTLLGVKDERWIDTVRMHHELPDGSGYPSQVRNTNPGAVLLGVCDSFNARMAQRDYRNNFTAEQAVKDLFAHADPLTSGFTAVVLEQLGIYPAGSLVQLVGNQIGCSLIRGETAITPVVLVFKNLPQPGGGAALVDSSQDEFKIRNALPRRGLGKLPALLDLLAKVV